jgi:hypothetical protein
MDRRQYLGAAAAGVAVGVVGVGGYTLLSDDAGGPPPVSDSPYPPEGEYPGSAREISLPSESDTHQGTVDSESFQLENDGPTIIRANHDDDVDGDVPFNMELISTTSDTTRSVVRLTGGYTGSSAVRPVPTGEYRLSVSGTPEQTPGAWEATVYDLPVYDEVGLSLPFEYNDVLNFVIGPINFSEAITDEELNVSVFEFTLDIETDDESIVRLIDSEGNFVSIPADGDILTSPVVNGEILRAPTADEYDGLFPAGGIGYIAIESTTEWTFSLEQSDQAVPDRNATASGSSDPNSTQTDQASSTNESG